MYNTLCLQVKKSSLPLHTYALSLPLDQEVNSPITHTHMHTHTHTHTQSLSLSLSHSLSSLRSLSRTHTHSLSLFLSLKSTNSNQYYFFNENYVLCKSTETKRNTQSSNHRCVSSPTHKNDWLQGKGVSSKKDLIVTVSAGWSRNTHSSLLLAFQGVSIIWQCHQTLRISYSQHYW